MQRVGDRCFDEKLYEAASIRINCLESTIRRQKRLLFFEMNGASANKVSRTATVLMVIGSFTSAGSKSEMETTARLGDDKGNTDVVIEHNLDVIKVADWIVDIGPEGGSGGGQILAEGTPESIASVESSYTGKFLKLEL